MALFQIFKGNERELSQVPLHEGYAYFCLDTGRLWIDISNTGSTSVDFPIAEDAARIPVNGALASGFVIDGEFITADSFVQISDLSHSGLLIGDGEGAITGIEIPVNAILAGDEDGNLTGISIPDKGVLVGGGSDGFIGVEIPDKAIVIGDSANGIAGLEVSGAGVLYALADGIPKWGLLPVVAGGTGKNSNSTNAVLLGNATDPIKEVRTASGAMYATGNNAEPQFGTLPVAQGGTGSTTALGARQQLSVYSKSEVYTRTETDDQIAKATTVAYVATLNVDEWSPNEEVFTYFYDNTAIRCGKAGDVPPLVACISNPDDYNLIDKAMATSGTGIEFTASTQPSADVQIVVIDVA